VAVYTHVSEGELRAALANFDVGALREYRGIPQGVENTNYDVTTDRGRFILTLFEKRVRESDLPFFLSLMDHLAKRGAPAPTPIAGKDGRVSHQLCGRPAVLISFLPGAPRMAPSPQNCRALGAMLARLHLATRDFALSRRNDLSLAGWMDLAGKCGDRADECADGLAALIGEEIAHLPCVWPEALPGGVVHADLFPDNVFFEGADITGIIDFYFSCTDFYAYDLAVCLISWAYYGGVWRERNAAEMIAGYGAVRALSIAERTSLPTLLRGASLRFLLTRLYDMLNQAERAVVRVKNPLEYRDLLRLLRESPQPPGVSYD
jgi:homoserine kinase type II